MERRYDIDRAGFGAHIRALRKLAGKSGVEVAGIVGLSQPTVSRLERGLSLCSRVELERILSACNASSDDRCRLVALWEALQRDYASWEIVHGKGFVNNQSQIAEQESQSGIVRIWQCSLIPGLLQTKEYSAAVINHFDKSHSKDASRSVDERQKRQMKMLQNPNRFMFLITPAIFWVSICSPEVMLRQIEFLTGCIQDHSIGLRMIGDEAYCSGVLPPSFCMFDKRVVVLEGLTGEVSLTAESEVSEYLLSFDQLFRQGVSGQDLISALQGIWNQLADSRK